MTTDRFHQQQDMHFKSSTSGSPACDLFSITENSAARGANTRSLIFSPSVLQNSKDNSSSLLFDSVPRLKHDTSLAIEWSIDEQYMLEEALKKNANEPNVMRYIKVAALLPEKTVRDVALRCKWMGRKRRKHEKQIIGKKVTDRKEILMESSLNNSISPASSLSTFSTTNNHDPNDSMHSGVISCAAWHLLEENKQAFSQISANISTLKLQQNIDIFFHTKNNLTKILNDIENMPGIMSRMPALPILLNEELVNRIRICPPSLQSIVLSSPMVTSLKQESGC